MRFVDVYDPRRVARKPDAVEVIMKSDGMAHDEFLIRRIEMRLYTEDVTGDQRGPYSLITSYVETDTGSIEMTYDEGFRGSEPLASAVRLLTENLGPSALVLRSVIALRGHLLASGRGAGDDGGGDGDNGRKRGDSAT